MPEVAGMGSTTYSDASWKGVSGKLPGTSDDDVLSDGAVSVATPRSDSFGTLLAKAAVVDSGVTPDMIPAAAGSEGGWRGVMFSGRSTLFTLFAPSFS